MIDPSVAPETPESAALSVEEKLFRRAAAALAATPAVQPDPAALARAFLDADLGERAARDAAENARLAALQAGYARREAADALRYATSHVVGVLAGDRAVLLEDATEKGGGLAFAVAPLADGLALLVRG